jgi:hypothetical protein
MNFENFEKKKVEFQHFQIDKKSFFSIKSTTLYPKN